MKAQLRENTRTILNKVETGGISAVQSAFLDQLEKNGSILTVATPNPEQLVMSVEDTAFWEALQLFEYWIPDGVGLQFANWWWGISGRAGRGGPLPQKLSRVAGREVVEWWLTHASKQKTQTTLLLGSKPEVAQRLARQVDPQGEWCFGSFGYSQVSELWSKTPSKKTLAEHQVVMELISTKKPAIIFVAFGAPYQELWIQRYRSELQKSGVQIVMVCGGALDTLVGDTASAPRIVGQLGLEWLWRLVLEPWRWRRQLRLITFLRGSL